MILTETKAKPIVDLLIKNAVDTIEQETGVKIPVSEIEEEIFDAEWIICGGYDENDEFLLHLNSLVNHLDVIMDRIEQNIFDEKEQESNVDF